MATKYDIIKALEYMMTGIPVTLENWRCVPYIIFPNKEAYYYEKYYSDKEFHIGIKLNKISFLEMIYIVNLIADDIAYVFLKSDEVSVKLFEHVFNKEVLDCLNLAFCYPNDFTGWKKDNINNKENNKMSNYKVEKHKEICKELTDLYERKNEDYGESYANLRKEYPESICIRLTDKLNRLKKITSSGYCNKVNDESVEDTLKDIANYAIMELIERNNKDNQNDKLIHYGVCPIKWGTKKSSINNNPERVLKCEVITSSSGVSRLFLNYIEYSKEKNKTRYNRLINKSWKDSAFEIGKYIYTFLDEIFDTEEWPDISRDMLARNAIWMGMDLEDHYDMGVYEYDLTDPEEYNLISDR